MKKATALFMAVFMVFAMAVSASAVYTDVPPSEGVLRDKTGYPYSVLMDGGNQYQVYYSSSPFYVNGDKVKTDGSYFVYRSIDGGWAFLSDSSGGITINKTDVAKSSHDLKNGDGSLFMAGDVTGFFFPMTPLAEMVLEVTEEELVTVTIPEMVGAMKVLVPCGVGLMALLVGLSLFGKRSLIFLR